MREERKTRYVEPEKPKKEEIKEEVEEKDHSKLKKFIIVLIVLIVAFLTYTIGIEPKTFTVKEYKVESSLYPESFEGLKIVQFTDLHYGNSINKKELDKIVSKINELKPDIIVFTGDLIDKDIVINENIQNEITVSLSGLNASLYKYAIYGNEDDEKIYKEIMEKVDFKLLKNEATLLYYKDNTPILIAGFDPIESNPKYSILDEPVDEVNTENLYKIILAHEPDTIDNIISYNPNLVLTGSTLGGSFKIFKPLFLNGSKHYLDYEKIDNTELYISNGLGTKGLNMRFNNYPSISLYRFYYENEENQQ